MSVQDFYDAMAEDYHLIFPDWNAWVDQQGELLHTLIRRFLPTAPQVTLYDCAAGIGTQALGLAKLGYTVHATDLSPAAIDRAKREAQHMGVEITTGVADFRTLREQVNKTFDVVIACDNAIPHLLTDDDLKLAAENLHAVVESGGLLLISLRDYDHVLAQKPRTTPVRVFDTLERRIRFQVWDWQDDLYTLHQYMIVHKGETPLTRHWQTQYRALRRDTLNRALEHAGFRDLRWHMPEASGYYQPIVTAHA